MSKSGEGIKSGLCAVEQLRRHGMEDVDAAIAFYVQMQKAEELLASIQRAHDDPTRARIRAYFGTAERGRLIAATREG